MLRMMINLIDDISFGLILALFYFKKAFHTSVPIKGQVGLQYFVNVYKKKLLKANSTFYKSIVSRKATLNAAT